MFFFCTGEAGLTFFDEEGTCTNCSCQFKLEEYLGKRGCCPTCADDFPFLNLRDMTLREKLLLKDKLRRELKAIKEKFNSLCNHTRHWLTDKEVEVTDIIACLGNSCDNVVKSQCKNQDVTVVFEIIKESCITFFEFGQMETIIKEILKKPDLEMIELLEGYKKELQIFLKRKIFLVPGTVFMKSKSIDKAYLVVKTHHVDKEWISVCSMADLIKLQGDIAEILDISAMDLNLVGVKEGCIELVYHVPIALMQEGFVFPLSSDQQNALETLGISKLQCGDWKYILSPKKGISRSLLYFQECVFIRHVGCSCIHECTPKFNMTYTVWIRYKV